MNRQSVCQWSVRRICTNWDTVFCFMEEDTLGLRQPDSQAIPKRFPSDSF